MREEYLTAGDIRLCYEVLGRERNPTVVLIMGLNLQLVWWPDEFCAGLVERGLRVVRFDNRDCGGSTTFHGRGVTCFQFLLRKAVPHYTLADMAEDVGALIAQVAPAGAHVVGASMGAFIAQETAIRYPERVRSLTSIMGRPGDGKTGTVAWSQRLGFLRLAPAEVKGQAEQLVKTFHRIGSLGRTAQDDEDVRVAVRRSAPRGPGGGGQLAAILAERDRTADLRRLGAGVGGGVGMPALVIHGDRDRVIRPSGGRATAAAIPGAELLVLPGMGHDLPRRLWPEILDGIARTVSRDPLDVTR